MRLSPCSSLFAAVALVIGCHLEAADHAARDTVLVPGMPPLSADVAAYRAGREQEIEALRAGSLMAAHELDSVGATAANLPIEEYRRMAAAMDAYLKARSVRTETGGAVPLDSALRRMDSLRVERLVLMVRIGVRGQDQP